jgi:hypothetical protein
VGEQGRTGDAGAVPEPRRRRAERLLGEAAAPSRPGTPRPAVETPPALRRAALAVAVEALILAGLAAYLLVLTLTGAADSVGRALAEVTYVGVGGAALAAGAVGLRRAAGWARGLVVVFQVLLGLLGYTTAFEGGRPLIGLPVLVLVAVTVYLLATPEARLAYLEQDVPPPDRA